MVNVVFLKKFQDTLSKIKEKDLRYRILNQISKIKDNPEVGKPMRNVRKNTRELYISPFRLSYSYSKSEDIVKILDLYHKNRQ